MSVCDDADVDLTYSLAKIIKRLNRSNISSSRSRDSGNISTVVPTLKRKPLIMLETLMQVLDTD